MIIADFDNIFAKSSKDTLVMEILSSENKDAYKDLFKIETTTSLDARIEKNEPLEPDEISTLIEARKKKRYGSQRQQGFCNRFFKQSGWQEKPKMIGLRDIKRSWPNTFLYFNYRILRMLFVSVWFYYLPVVVMIFANLKPVMNNALCRQGQVDGKFIDGLCQSLVLYHSK